ncbi:MAG TPA: hypothetical protein VKX17_21075 [Planctomycetota bacterium]|nr:hypothetical protein [Planctomycetota bacterium]
MKKALATLIIIAALAAGGAYYMGWISFSVDKEKAKADMKEGAEKAKELGQEGVEKAKELGQEVKDKLKKTDTTTINNKPVDDTKKPD